MHLIMEDSHMKINFTNEIFISHMELKQFTYEMLFLYVKFLEARVMSWVPKVNCTSTLRFGINSLLLCGLAGSACLVGKGSSISGSDSCCKSHSMAPLTPDPLQTQDKSLMLH